MSTTSFKIGLKFFKKYSKSKFGFGRGIWVIFVA